MRGADRDKAAEASRDREVERVEQDAAAIDFRVAVSQLFPAIPIIGALRAPDQGRRDNPSGYGSVARSVAPPASGEHNRQLHSLKSHGTAHSNLIREFMRGVKGSCRVKSILDPRGSGSVRRALPGGPHVCRQRARAASTGQKQFPIRMRSTGSNQHEQTSRRIFGL